MARPTFRVAFVTMIDGVDNKQQHDDDDEYSTIAAVMPTQMLMGASMRIPALESSADTSQIQKFGQSFSA